VVQVRGRADGQRSSSVAMDSMTNIGFLPRLRFYTGLGHYRRMNALQGVLRAISGRTAPQATAS